MFGLLLRSIQAYLRGTFGPAAWARVLRAAGQPAEGFEPMLPYDARVVHRVLAAAAQELDRPAEAILEDVGTFLVADPGHRALRRLLRFGGAGFTDFLHSLEELPDRARLALPGLHLPQITLSEGPPGQVRLRVTGALPALIPVALGALRAMADDYGALVLIDLDPGRDGATLTVQLLETAHGEGRSFALAQEGAADGM
jgi:hypothetical protein